MRCISVLLTSVALAACGAEGSFDDPDPTQPDGSDGGRTSSSPEPCDGLDNDGDGMVDEICTCASGATQACWPGDPAQRGRGNCHDGTQMCDSGSNVEFAGWGSCVGAVLPATEIPGNCIDEDCNGDTPGCQTACSEFETCDNARDDDCDGLVDCDDDACDCPVEVDCAVTPELCTCEDLCVAGTERFCDEPEFCSWGIQSCAPDGHWGACVETDRVPPECEDPFAPFGTWYDPNCCVAAGLCCQNFGHDPSLPSDASVGSCAGIVNTVCTPNLL